MLAIKKIDPSCIESEVFELLKSHNYKPKKHRVFIKPNIVGPVKPESGVVTHPKVVEGVIRYLKSIQINDIYIGDGPCIEEVDYVYKKTGYRELCRRLGVVLVDLHKEKREKIKFRNRWVLLPKIVLESEYLNIAKLKTHIQTTVSLCTKNQKGLLDLKTKRAFHKDLDKNIAALANAIKPSLCIIDAITAIEGNGPGQMGCLVKNLDLIVIGDNMRDVDEIGCRIFGLKGSKIEHLKLCSDHTTQHARRLVLPKIAHSFIIPPPIKYGETQTLRRFNLYLHYAQGACSGCTVLIGQLKGSLIRSPITFLRMGVHSLIEPIHFITGEHKKLALKGKLICIGNCTKKIKRKKNDLFVPGCPPKVEDVVKKL
ncbi:MAG: DUF362 domain-containing protein [Candidatus Woesearchaeota archaeon]